MLISQIYFWNKTLHVSDSFSVHHQEFFTAHTTIVYVIQVCWQLASRIRTELIPSWSCSQTCMTYIIAVCTVDGQKNCSKHVEFYSKNKFEKLAHAVGFIISSKNTYVHTHTHILLVIYEKVSGIVLHLQPWATIFGQRAVNVQEEKEMEKKRWSRWFWVEVAILL